MTQTRLRKMCVRQSVLSSTHMTTLSIAIRVVKKGFSCELNVCHKLVSIWWMREQTCLQTKECQVYQFESSTNISRQFENAHQTILRLVSNSSFLKSCDHPSEALRNFLQLLRLFIRQFTIPLCVNFLASRYFSVAVAEIRYSNFLPHSSAIVSFNLHLRWVRPKYTGSRMLMVRPDLQVPSISSTLKPYSEFFQPFWHHPRVTSRIIFVSDEQQDIPNSVLFFNSSPSRIFSNCLSHKTPTSGWPFKFRSRGTTGSSMSDQYFGHVCRRKRIHISGHSGFGFLSHFWSVLHFSWVSADTASPACPVQSGSLGMTSITFAPVICAADGSLF